MATKKTTVDPEPIKAYKGFSRNDKGQLVCRGFVYEPGQTYEQASPAKLCASGFHAVLNPTDAFRYYAANESEFYEVELEGVDPRRDDDSKIAGRKITIGAKLGVAGLMKAHLNFTFAKIETVREEVAAKAAAALEEADSGDFSTSATSGDSSTSAT